jgi:hypothetical protein
MRHAGSRGSALLTVAALVAMVLIGSIASQAQLGGLVGSTTTVTTSTTNLLGSVLTTTVLAGTGPLIGGTIDEREASALDGNIPPLLTGEALHAVTIGWSDQVASEASLAALDLDVAGLSIGADFVMARARAVFGYAGVGTSTIENLSINGVPVWVTGARNQTIGVPGGVVVLNEQRVLSDGTTVVNALHATVYGVADVVVASAKAGVQGGEAKAVQASY